MTIHRFQIALCIFISSLFLFSCGDKKESPAVALPKGPTEYQKIIQRAYEYKKTGYNRKALEEFQKAFPLATPQSTIYASALDDQASVLVRLGRYDEAEKLFRQSIQILNNSTGNAALLSGVERRLETLDALKKRNITCREPDEPDTASDIPYFPVVPAYQRLLGDLTRKVAVCRDSNEIVPITIRIVITGDGKFVRAYAKDDYAGTDTEKCVVQKLEQLLPQLHLPRFAACYRGFTYPFMIGNHPSQQPNETAPADTSTADIPTENAEKGTQPLVDSAIEGAQKLLNAYQSGDTEDAMPFFFPESAFEIVKDSPNPLRYYNKLVNWYKEDINLERDRLKDESWEVESVALGNCKWKAPGTEANKIGYWSCTRNTVTVKSGDRQRRFEIQVLINWGADWYITHLRPVRNE